MSDFWQAVDEGHRALGRGLDDPAVLIMTPNTLTRLTQLATARGRSLDRLEVEVDPAVPADAVMVVPYRQMTAYRGARRKGRTPVQAAYESAYQQAVPAPAAPTHPAREAWAEDWTVEDRTYAAAPPEEPSTPRAAPQPRRRFPIPR